MRKGEPPVISYKFIKSRVGLEKKSSWLREALNSITGGLDVIWKMHWPSTTVSQDGNRQPSVFCLTIWCNKCNQGELHKQKQKNKHHDRSRGPVDLLKNMLLSLSFFQPKSLGGTVAKTVMLFDIILHHCQGEGKQLSLMLPSHGRKGGVVGKSWLVFFAVFHVNHLFVPLSYTFHCYHCTAVVHFLISFLFPVNFFLSWTLTHLLCL